MELSGCRIRLLLSRREENDSSWLTLQDNSHVLDSDWTSDDLPSTITGTTEVPCFIVGGGDTRLYCHDDYGKRPLPQQQQLYGVQTYHNTAAVSRPSDGLETYPAYLSADVVFRQSTSIAEAVTSLHIPDDRQMNLPDTVYVLDNEATAHLDHVKRLNPPDRKSPTMNTRVRRSIKKDEQRKVTRGPSPPPLPPKPADWSSVVANRQSVDVRLSDEGVTRSSDVSWSSQAATRCIVMSGDPILPVRRSKTGQSTVPPPAASAQRQDVNAMDNEPGGGGGDLRANRQVVSDSEEHCYESVRDSAAVRSASVRGAASLGHLPGPSRAVTSTRSHVTTSTGQSVLPAMTDGGPVQSHTEGVLAAVTTSQDSSTAALYSQPHDTIRRGPHTTETHRSVTAPPPLPTRAVGLLIHSVTDSAAVTAADDDDDGGGTSASSDNYESVKYTPSNISNNELYLRPRHQEYSDVVATIKSQGGRVLTKDSVVIVHRLTGQQDMCSDDDDDVSRPLLCYDRRGSALLVTSPYLRRHDDPRDEPWYYPVPLTAHQASLLLRDSNQPGSFLVYRNDEHSYQLAVSLGGNTVVHYDLHVSALGEWSIHGDRRYFLSVSHLINYYRQNTARSLPTRLLRPVRDVRMRPTPGHHFPAHAEIDRKRLHFTENIIGIEAGSRRVMWSGVYNGRPVAVTVVEREDTSFSDAAAVDDEFVNETNVLLAIQHDNIVKLIGVSSVSSPLLIISEHGFDGTLKDQLRVGKIPSQHSYSRRLDLVDIAAQMSAAVAYLASLRYVIHRDLSASAFVVSIDAGPRVKLTNFGRARRVSADDCYIADGNELVAVKWAAPEVLSHLCYSTRSDVWALGVVLWELFSQRCERPFTGLSAEQTAVYVAHGGRLDCPAGCDDDVYKLMVNCWKHEAEHRPTAASVHCRLVTLRSDNSRSTAAGEPPPPPPPLRHSHSDSNDALLLIDRNRKNSKNKTLTGTRLSVPLSATFSTSSTTLNSRNRASLEISSSSDHSLPHWSPSSDDLTSLGEFRARSTAVKIRDSFRKLITPRNKPRRLAMTSVDSSLPSPSFTINDQRRQLSHE